MGIETRPQLSAMGGWGFFMQKIAPFVYVVHSYEIAGR